MFACANAVAANGMKETPAIVMARAMERSERDIEILGGWVVRGLTGNGPRSWCGGATRCRREANLVLATPDDSPATGTRRRRDIPAPSARRDCPGASCRGRASRNHRGAG